MPKSNLLISLLLTITLLATRTSVISAARAWQEADPVRGTVQSIVLETDTTTGITTVTVTLADQNELFQTVRVSIRTALVLGFVTLDGDGKPDANNSFLGHFIEIDRALLIPEREANRHPVGNALATLFSDLRGINYETIMIAHNKGSGFGVIVEALWLTAKLKGDSQVFQAILNARQSGDFTAFHLADGTALKDWGQLRKAILDAGKQGNPGITMSRNDMNSDGNDSRQGNSPEKNKEKDKEKNNNGTGIGVPEGNQDHNGDGNGKDKEKDKEKNNNGAGNNKK